MYNDPKQGRQTEMPRPVMDRDITGRTDEDLYSNQTNPNIPPEA
jgi:hypothetical protein